MLTVTFSAPSPLAALVYPTLRAGASQVFIVLGTLPYMKDLLLFLRGEQSNLNTGEERCICSRDYCGAHNMHLFFKSTTTAHVLLNSKELINQDRQLDPFP